MDQKTATRLLDYEIWANGRSRDSIHKASTSSGADPAVMNECTAWYAHIQAARRIWLDRILATEVANVVVWPDWTLEDADRECAVMNGAFEGWLQGSPDFESSANYANTAGEAFTTPVADILWHLFTHGGYHRGQIAARLRSGGFEPINTDFMMFVRD